MFSMIFVADSVRPLVPLVFIAGTSVPAYASIVAWRIISAPLPARIYHYVDDCMWGFYQRFCLFFFENVSGVQLNLYGEALECFKNRETVLYISNHQCTVDWIVADMLAIRQGTLGGLRYILKDTLQYVPLYGWYFYQHGCVYVRRSGKFRADITGRQLDFLANYPHPVLSRWRAYLILDLQFWLVLFPEGTRFTPQTAAAVERRRQLARGPNLPALNHVHVPRVRGLQLALGQLRDKLDAIYDVTIAYGAARDPRSGKQLQAPAMTDFVCCRPGAQLHVRMDRIAMSEIPTQESELAKWCYDRFARKDEMLSQFYSSSNQSAAFPDLVEKDSILPLRATLAPLTVYSIALAPLIWSSNARKVFGLTWILGTVASIVVMKIRRGA